MKTLPIALLVLLSTSGLAAQPGTRGAPAREEPAVPAEAALDFSADAKANETCKFHLLVCGETVQSELTEQDCALSNGSFSDRWLIPAWGKQFVTTAAESDAFAVQLRLILPGNRGTLGTTVAPPGATASLRTFAAISGYWSAAVISDTSSAAKTGPYTLSLECEGTPLCQRDVWTACILPIRERGVRGLKYRYRLQAAFENQFVANQLGYAFAQGHPGYVASFTFLGDNDLVVKLLPAGDRVKVFYTQLTNLNFKLGITDMVTGVTKIYRNTPDDCGNIDQNAFPGAASAGLVKALGDCKPDGDTGCMLNGRFAVEVDWANQYTGESGRAGALGTSGFFYFTHIFNYEVVVRFMDFGDRVKFFYGALTDLEYTIHVTDTLTGEVKHYYNPPGRFCGGIDNEGF